MILVKASIKDINKMAACLPEQAGMPGVGCGKLENLLASSTPLPPK
jgi:hypothetical protein